jgi:hypothetical protein
MKFIIPRLGKVLRAIITSSGHRHAFFSTGLDKSIDGIANESRPGSVCDLMQKAEEFWVQAVLEDCGAEWSQLGRIAWSRTREALQYLALNVDSSALPDRGGEQIEALISVPMLSSAMALANHYQPGPNMTTWWASPFSAWVDFASETVGIDRCVILENLANFIGADIRSIERWSSGERVGLLCAPYRSTVSNAVGEHVARRMESRDTDRLAGWLMAAVAFQAQPKDLRDKVERDYRL